jgi:hypothetical protein
MTDPSTPVNPLPMQPLRGSLILCDQLYPTIAGKWIIAGTYTAKLSRPGQERIEFPDGVNVYLRFQVEQAQRYHAEILLINRGLTSTTEPLQRHELDLDVADPRTPIELACILDPFQVHCPIPLAAIPPAGLGVALLVWLRVNGEDLASCPLNLIFRPLEGAPHAGHEPRQPESGGTP